MTSTVVVDTKSLNELPHDELLSVDNERAWSLQGHISHYGRERFLFVTENIVEKPHSFRASKYFGLKNTNYVASLSS